MFDTQRNESVKRNTREVVASPKNTHEEAVLLGRYPEEVSQDIIREQAQDSVKIQELKEKIEKLPMVVRQESADQISKRNEQECAVRTLFAKLSTENQNRKAKRGVSVGIGSDKIFEGAKNIQAKEFSVGATEQLSVSKEEYTIDGKLRTRVALRSRNGEKLYVDNLLPEGVRLVPGIVGEGDNVEEYFQYGTPERGHKERTVYYGDLSTPVGIFALFHEIGHAWNDEAGLPSGSQGMTVSAAFGKISDKFFGTHFERNILEMEMLEERDASAHAFRVLRFLSDAGFPMQEAASRQVMDDVQACLNTYQKSYEKFGSIDRLKPRRSFVSGKIKNTD